jgi:hypothetical protein
VSIRHRIFCFFISIQTASIAYTGSRNQLDIPTLRPSPKLEDVEQNSEVFFMKLFSFPSQHNNVLPYNIKLKRIKFRYVNKFWNDLDTLWIYIHSATI